MLVLSVEAKGDKAAILVMDDGSRIWTPEKDKADELVGKPIPSDWTQKEGNFGPQAFPPRAKSGFGGGGPAAFRNTKEGQAYEQERMDRRTALMQAVQWCMNGGDILDVRSARDEFYQWLRNTSSTVVGQHSGEKPASGRAEQAGGGGSTSGEGLKVTTATAHVAGMPPPNSSAAERNEGSDRAADKAGGGGAIPGEEVAPPPSDDVCVHPAESRRETASGRLRCKLCGAML